MKVDSIALVTGNSGKLNEFRNLLSIDSIIFQNKSLDIPEIQSMNIEDIGLFKTQAALGLSDELIRYDAIMTDDTALSCEGLNGLPGPFIKWFLNSIGAAGLHKLVKTENAKCTAVCLLTLGIIKTGEIIQFKGEVQGKIVAPRGTHGFGWDGIFLADGFDITYGEMDLDRKNLVSHRAIAVKKLRTWITGQQ